MNENKRFIVHDRGARVARDLWNFSNINPRYQIIDTTTRKVVDETTTKRAATETARLFENGVFNV